MEYIGWLVILWQILLLGVGALVFAPFFAIDSDKDVMEEIERISPYVGFVAFGVILSLASFMYPELKSIPIAILFSKVTKVPELAFLFGVSATYLLIGILSTESIVMRSTYMCLSIILLFPSVGGADWLSESVLYATAGKTISIATIVARRQDKKRKELKRIAAVELDRKRRLEEAMKRSTPTLGRKSNSSPRIIE